MTWYYAYGHKADPVEFGFGVARWWGCRVCRQPLTFIKQTNQPDQWRHPRKKRAK